MTPAARLSAAIEILDDYLAGGAPEQLLTTWGRKNRYAGSKDRAAIRDIVYDALRCRRSFAALGGAETGRGLVLGGVRACGEDPATLFTGERFAPAPLSKDEVQAPDLASVLEGADYDLPAWAVLGFREVFGQEWTEVALTQRQRAGVHLRVNTLKGDAAKAMRVLAEDEIVTRPHHLCDTALEVTQNARRVRNSRAYQEGYVELQDAASQALVSFLDVQPGMGALDYCAGGGGKALAMAGFGAKVTAHDVVRARMADIPVRAARAGVEIARCETSELSGGYDLVLVDAPCSGSGTWARAPQGKWSMTPEGLADLTRMQFEILQEAQGLVGAGGSMAYATCSVFRAENEAVVSGFLEAHPHWHLGAERRFSPLEGGDGFYVAILTRT